MTMKRSLSQLAFAVFFACSAMAAQAAGTLNLRIGGEPASIDPALNSESSGTAVLKNTFEGLTTVDPKGNIISGTAKSWDVSPDGLVWTFHLRPDAKWSDGKPVTAEDFVYGWRRTIDPKTASSYAYYLFPVKNAQAISEGKAPVDTLGIKALNPETLQVTLEHPAPYFADMTTYPATYPERQDIIEKYGKNWTQPPHFIGNGPFKLVEWSPNARLVLEKNPEYYDAKDVSLDKVILHEIENESSAFSRYRAGELDIASPPLDQFEWARKNLADQMRFSKSLATYYYGFNLTKPPFKDNPKLRRALNMAIDRNLLIKKVLADQGQTPAYTILPPYTAHATDWQPAWASWPRAKQIAEAKKLYKEAGYGPGHEASFSLLYNTNEAHKKIAIAIASMWHQILGANVNLTNEEWKVMLSDVRRGNMQMFRTGWSADYNDPTTFLNIFLSNSGQNSVRFQNPEYDKVMAESDDQLNPEKRQQLLQKADEILANADAIVPIYYYGGATLVKPYIQGYFTNVRGGTLPRYLSKTKE